MLKISIVLPLWGRANIFSLVSKNLENFVAKNEKYTFEIVFVLSPEDSEKNILLNIIRKAKYGKKVISYPNNYMGAKMNAGIISALDSDYIMNLGSDDLIHPYIMTLYEPYIEKSELFFGLDSLYFYDFYEKKSYFFKYYNIIHAIGAGRMMKTELIEKIINKRGFLYSPTKMRALDTNSANNISLYGFTELTLKAGSFPYICDIKAEKNINSMGKILEAKNKRHIEIVDNDILYLSFPGILEKKQKKQKV